MEALTNRLRRGAFDQASFQFAPQLLLCTAVKLKIFPALAARARSVDSLAVATGCSRRGLPALLNCLAAMRLLEKNNDRYGLSAVSRRHLLPCGKEYVGGLFSMSDLLIKLWLTLPKAVETGRPTLASLSAEERETLNLGIVQALFQAYRGCAWRLAERCKALRPKKILDVAAGSAVWSIPFALRNRHAEVTAIDLAKVLEVTRKYTRRFHVEHQYRFVEGDIERLQFGREEYDLALLGHICHSEGASGSRALIAKCFHALRAGGRLFVIDYVPDERRKEAALPLMLAVNALLGSGAGDTFTFSEYKTWLVDAGFHGVRSVGLWPHSPVVVAVKG